MFCQLQLFAALLVSLHLLSSSKGHIFANGEEDSSDHVYYDGLPRYVQKFNAFTTFVISESKSLCRTRENSTRIRAGVKVSAYSVQTGSRLWYTVLCDGLHTDDIYFASCGVNELTGHLAVAVYRNQSMNAQVHAVSVNDAVAVPFILELDYKHVTRGIAIRAIPGDSDQDSFAVYTASENWIYRTLSTDVAQVQEEPLSSLPEGKGIQSIAAYGNSLMLMSTANASSNYSLPKNGTRPIFPDEDDVTSQSLVNVELRRGKKVHSLPIGDALLENARLKLNASKLTSLRAFSNYSSTLLNANNDSSEFNFTFELVSLSRDVSNYTQVHFEAAESFYGNLVPLSSSGLHLAANELPNMRLDSMIVCGGRGLYLYAQADSQSGLSIVSVNLSNFSQPTLQTYNSVLNNSLTVMSATCFSPGDEDAESVNFGGHVIFLLSEESGTGGLQFSALAFSVDKGVVVASLDLSDVLQLSKDSNSTAVYPLSIVSSGFNDSTTLMTFSTKRGVSAVPIDGSSVTENLNGVHTPLRPCMSGPNGRCNSGSSYLDSTKRTKSSSSATPLSVILGSVLGCLGAVVLLGVFVTIFVRKHYKQAQGDPFDIGEAIVASDHYFGTRQSSTQSKQKSKSLTPLNMDKQHKKCPRRRSKSKFSRFSLDSLESLPSFHVPSDSYLNKPGSSTSPLWSHTSLSSLLSHMDDANKDGTGTYPCRETPSVLNFIGVSDSSSHREQSPFKSLYKKDLHSNIKNKGHWRSLSDGVRLPPPHDLVARQN